LVNVEQTARPFDDATISVFYFDHLRVDKTAHSPGGFGFSNRLPSPFVKGLIFDRKQFETRPNVWPGTVVRLRQLMASDGPVANCSWVVRRLGPTFTWGMSADSALACASAFSS
jgi:hypothetical protein